ncbi:hypothetical protein DFH08DRAFT_824059 [Mycena albidolilacea]|uniref:Uncharacterized protein n=1 Tax=Mycena albidolilacea TaxID=1033008 RepID=A0AAD6Z5S2_9AGAR|nr:hypothetical protein DFH08DRAFT_824059 [Mycena albidolilacea]
MSEKSCSASDALGHTPRVFNGLQHIVVTFPGTNFAQYGIGNATPSTDLAAVGYVSPVNKAFAGHPHSGVSGDVILKVDPVTIATVPLGGPIAAFQSNLYGSLPQVIVVQYIDVNRLLTQRFTTSDDNSTDWSASVTITT